jgi:prephenate dehydratase
LLGLKDAKLSGVKEVYSQRPALGQVQKLIKELGLVEREWSDTAGSAKHVAEMGDPKCAAIASSLAGELYGLDVLRADVEDETHNMTRFLIVGGQDDDAPNDGRAIITTFLFRVKNIPAALYKALGGFATNGVNMTKLESYQLGGSFNATEFYADIEGHPDQANVRRALEELQFFTSKLTTLGVYPAHPFRAEMP